VRVLIVPNTGNPNAVTATAELVTWLSGNGAEPVMTSTDAAATGLHALGLATNELGTPDLAVALGGDGTILKAFHALGEAEVPLLGVKFGRLGFLSGADADTMRDSVEAALAGEARIERRATLKADVFMDGRLAGSYRAMNEVVVSRGASARVIALEVTIDGHRIAELRADGAVVATATGSTAYALSAGGPIVSPGFGGLVVVPVAPHTLLARALVTGPSDTVEIALSDPTRSDACVIVDGDVAPCRRSLDRVIVRRGDHDVALVKLHGRDFYDTVAEEFFGG
jgi:NAD+ kinase